MKSFRKHYGYNLDKAKQTIEPTQLNEYESKLLNQEDSALALIFSQTTYLENGIPIEYTKATLEVISINIKLH